MHVQLHSGAVEQGVAQVPLLSMTLPVGHSHLHVEVLKLWPVPVGQLLETQLPLHSTCPDAHAAAQVPLALSHLPLQH